MHHYFFRFCRIYAIIAIKNDFPFINIRQVPRGVLKTEGVAFGFQHSPRDLANVNEWEIMFDHYNLSLTIVVRLFIRKAGFLQGWSVYQQMAGEISKEFGQFHYHILGLIFSDDLKFEYH